MTTTVRSPRLLMLSSIVLAVAGAAALGGPHDRQPSPPAPATAPTADAATDASTGAALPAGTPHLATAASPPAAVRPSARPSALPPHGEGAAGDAAIQHTLQAAWPADLPPADEQALLTAGRALLRADATGAGRQRWPSLFGVSGRAVAPAFAAARFRIQAAIARRDGGPTRAVVHLVWAGTDRGGTYTDLRITDWHFTRTTRKGTATWTVQPRT